jgi:hypothetical protein
MTDPLRTDRLPTAGDVPERERDARIERLLLTGLDHYFSGQHELAISVWTRVLFLDRGHARARAYIERARGAIAERQREGDELLHSGVAAFDRGDASTARQLLTSAVERGAPSEEAVALLDRLDRLEQVTPRPHRRSQERTAPGAAHQVPPPEIDRDKRARIAWIAIGVCAGLGVAAVAAWLWTGANGIWSTTSAAGTPPAAALQPEPLLVPSSAEAALTRAVQLNSSGRLHDALDVLEGIRLGDPLRPQSDALRAAIQRQLLESGRAMQASQNAKGSASPAPAK